jgi:aminoglycoside 3-N-acetyltransferase
MKVSCIERTRLVRTSIKSRVYTLIRWLLTQDRRARLKKRFVATRRRLDRVYRFLYREYNAKDLIGELSSKIASDFEILMVHSSYDRLLPMYSETPNDLVAELLEFCGKNRTLVMPTFVLGGRSYDKETYFRDHIYNVKRTPSEMGLLTEVFRRRPGVKRSLHPTHSVCAYGPLADELTSTHHKFPTRAGVGSPFEMMSRRETVIAGLGIEYFRCLTQTHTAEDIMGDEFPIMFERKTIEAKIVDWEGKTIPYDLTIKTTSRHLDQTLLRRILQSGELLEWRYNGTPLFLTYARLVTQRLIEAAKAGMTVYRNIKVR